MKKILLALSLALVSTAFVACNQKELDNQKATIDSLQSVVDAKDNEINDLFDMLNDIEENMSAINSKYSTVQEMRHNNTEGSYNHKNEIASQMKSICGTFRSMVTLPCTFGRSLCSRPTTTTQSFSVSEPP